MSQTKERNPIDHEVGYCKPPAHRRFRKGQSGNPGGRPRGMTAGRATALALKELYRPVTVREGDKLRKLPAIQAVLRSQVALAAKGNGPAQRALFEIACEIEKAALAAQAAPNDDVPAKTSDLEAARRIAAALMKVARDNPR
jgi:Family of unknown function (DUF5681)